MISHAPNVHEKIYFKIFGLVFSIIAGQLFGFEKFGVVIDRLNPNIKENVRCVYEYKGEDHREFIKDCMNSAIKDFSDNEYPLYIKELIAKPPWFVEIVT